MTTMWGINMNKMKMIGFIFLLIANAVNAMQLSDSNFEDLANMQLPPEASQPIFGKPSELDEAKNTNDVPLSQSVSTPLGVYTNTPPISNDPSEIVFLPCFDEPSQLGESNTNNMPALQPVSDPNAAQTSNHRPARRELSTQHYFFPYTGILYPITNAALTPTALTKAALTPTALTKAVRPNPAFTKAECTNPAQVLPLGCEVYALFNPPPARKIKKLAFIGNDGWLRMWLGQDNQIHTFLFHGLGLKFSATGKYLAVIQYRVLKVLELGPPTKVILSVTTHCCCEKDDIWFNEYGDTGGISYWDTDPNDPKCVGSGIKKSYKELYNELFDPKSDLNYDPIKGKRRIFHDLTHPLLEQPLAPAENFLPELKTAHKRF